MTIGRIDINEKNLPKICRAIIELEERVDNGTSGGGGTPEAGGRLTLTTATSITTTDVAGATTVYYTPHDNLFVPIYDGTNMTPTTITAELSLALDSNA